MRGSFFERENRLKSLAVTSLFHGSRDYCGKLADHAVKICLASRLQSVLRFSFSSDAETARVMLSVKSGRVKPADCTRCRCKSEK